MRYGEFIPYWYKESCSEKRNRYLSAIIGIYAIVVLLFLFKYIKNNDELNKLNLKKQVYNNNLSIKESRIDKKINLLKELQAVISKNKNYDIIISENNGVKIISEIEDLEEKQSIIKTIGHIEGIKLSKYFIVRQEEKYNLEMELVY